MNIKKLLGQRIKELRKNKKLTQEQIAEFVGIEPASLSNIENGKYYPTAENLEKILIALESSPEKLFKIEQYQNNEDLLKEINLLLKNNPQKIKDVYKIVKVLVD